LEVNKQKAHVAVIETTGKTQIFYLSPIAQYGKKTVTLPIDWDATLNGISVTLPDSVSYPIVVAFSISPKILAGTDKWSIAFPSLRRRLKPSGEVEVGSSSSESSDESEEEEIEKEISKKQTKVYFIGLCNLYFSCHSKPLLFFPVYFRSLLFHPSSVTSPQRSSRNGQ
jgi:hypothetical protein